MSLFIVSSADVVFGGDKDFVEDSRESQEISAMVNFLVANKNKIMQICLEDDKSMELSVFENIFQNVLENKITPALLAGTRVTAIILDLLDVNNIKY